MLGRAGATMKDFFGKETWAAGGGVAIGDKVIAPMASLQVNKLVDPEGKITGWSQVALNGVVKVGIGALLWSASGMLAKNPMIAMFVKFMGIGSMVSFIGDVMVELYPPLAQYEAKGLLAITGRHGPGERGPQIPQPGPTRATARTPRGKVIVRGTTTPQAAQAPVVPNNATDWTDEELKQYNFLTPK